MNNTYTPLEPGFTGTIASQAPSFTVGQAATLFTSFNFLFTLSVGIIVVVGAGAFAYAGWQRIQPSEQSVTKSNKTAKRAVLGTLGVVSLYVLLKMFNADLVTGNVGLDALSRGYTAGQVAVVTGTNIPSAPPSTCASTQSVIQSLNSGNVCAGVTCRVLSGCNYQQYLPVIESEAANAGISKNVVIALICKESTARRDAQNRNQNGTYDCGLMQVNQRNACDAASLDVTNNIRRGIAVYKQALQSARQTYPNIPSTAGAFASYNCCANGTVPNAPSNDCTQAAGFPSTIPKWACPINPGTASSNMCAVKNYACELTACVNQLGG